MRDMTTNIQVKRLFSPAAQAADNTARVSQIIDRLGYDSVTFILQTGSVPDADATYAVTVDEGDASNLSDAAAVAATDLIGSDPASASTALVQAGYTFASDDQVRKIGYRGIKRYVRVTVTPANNTGADLLAGVAILGHPDFAPVAQATA